MAGETPQGGGVNGSGSFFQPNEIRSATDADFDYFIGLAEDEGEGWIKKLDKNGIIIWQKETGVSSIKIAKVCSASRPASYAFCTMHVL